MNIGVDLDGVLFDSEKIFWEYAQRFDLLNSGNGIVNENELRAQNRYNWTAEQKKEFELGCVQIQKSAPFMTNSIRVLKALSKKNKIFIITGRGNTSTKEIKISKRRLKESGISFEKMLFKVSNKLEECKKHKIDIMIEDYYDTAKTLSENGIECFYYCDIVKKNIKNKNIINVKNWSEIATELIRKNLIDKYDI